MRAATDRQARVNRGQTQRARALLCGVEVLRGHGGPKGASHRESELLSALRLREAFSTRQA